MATATDQQKAKKGIAWGTPDGGLIVPQHRVRQSFGLCLDRSNLGTRQEAPNGQEFDHRFIASTETLASDGGVILLSAWRLARYQARPRWIAMHDIFGWSGKLTEITLGRAVWAGIEDGFPVAQVGETGRALVIYVRYSDSDFAQEVKFLYEDGGLDDVSVRWDPRTEDVRNPFEEEVIKFGAELNWVAVRVDLVELSAILLGADQGPNMTGGAQLIRAAFDRCRSAGHTMKAVPALVDKIETMRQDEAALTDSLGLLQQAIDALDAWLQGSGDIREALGDAVANLAALLSSDQQTGTTSAGDGKDDERQGGLTVETLRAAIEVLTESIEKLIATRSGDDGNGGGGADGDDGGGESRGEGGKTEIDALREQVEAVAELVQKHVHACPAGKKKADDKKKAKKGKVVSGGEQAGGSGGDKYDATAGKKKGDDPPEGGEREGEDGNDSPAGDAEGGEAAGDHEGGGDDEGSGDEGGEAGGAEAGTKNWSELGEEDEIAFDLEAIMAAGKSEAGQS